MQFSNYVSTRMAGHFRKGLLQWLIESLVITLITWFGGPTPSAAQVTSTDLSLHPAIVCLSHAGGQITKVNTENNSVIATAPFPNSANGVVVTPEQASSVRERLGPGTTSLLIRRALSSGIRSWP